MKEYIEREAAIELGKKQSCAGIIDGGDFCNISANMLRNIPAADVVEVRHGIPDPIEETYEDGAHVYRHIVGYACPFCGSDRIAKYCADCGAKMDGGVNDAAD